MFLKVVGTERATVIGQGYFSRCSVNETDFKSEPTSFNGVYQPENVLFYFTIWWNAIHGRCLISIFTVSMQPL